MLKIFFGTLIGYAAHALHKPTARFGPRWGLLLRYGIGTAIVLPVMLMFLPRAWREQVATAYVSAVAGVGTGVIVGYIVDDAVE